jgi:hypothetical protein
MGAIFSKKKTGVLKLFRMAVQLIGKTQVVV